MLLEVPVPVKTLSAAVLLTLPCLLVSSPQATAQTPAVKIETGTLNGASYRIDMPAKWNGVLVIYYHGYAEFPVVFDQTKPNPVAEAFTGAGYAVAQSGYSDAGWVVEQAMPQTEALRRYTIAHYGQPKETYVTGHSMGGLLTAATIQSYPSRYDDALDLCGLLEPTTWALARGGAFRSPFDFY